MRPASSIWHSHFPTLAGIGYSSDFPDIISLKNSLNVSLLSVSQQPPTDHTTEKAKAACNHKGKQGRENVDVAFEFPNKSLLYYHLKRSINQAIPWSTYEYFYSQANSLQVQWSASQIVDTRTLQSFRCLWKQLPVNQPQSIMSKSYVAVFTYNQMNRKWSEINSLCSVCVSPWGQGAGASGIAPAR